MSYTNLLYHIVYATKEGAPLITKTLRPRLHEYLGGTVRGLGGVALEVNGVADHVHILAKLRDDFGIGIHEQVKIRVFRLGKASDRGKIWLASAVRSLHRERVTS
jgi:REP element-mobilizing transposase RayT